MFSGAVREGSTTGTLMAGETSPTLTSVSDTQISTGTVASSSRFQLYGRRVCNETEFDFDATSLL